MPFVALALCGISVRRLDECLTRRANTGNLYDNVAILCPRKVRGFRRFRVERSRGVRCKLALIPGLTASEVECPGKDCDSANLVRVPVRRGLPTSWGIKARPKKTRGS